MQSNTYELTEFLHDILKVRDFPWASFPHTVGLHNSCSAIRHLHAASMSTARMGLDRSVNPPGISTTIAHLLQALDEVRPGASELVRRMADKEIADIVGLWPPAFETVHAQTLGFAKHEPIVEVVRAFLEDDLEATRSERGQA